jgi:hypothetical protein
LLSKALDIYKNTLRGELKKIPLLYAENKNTYLSSGLYLEDDFDEYIKKLRYSFFQINNFHFERYLSITQYKEHGINLTNIKKRFIDTSLFFKNQNNQSLDIKISHEELEIIKIACDLYWNVQIANIEFVNQLTFFQNKTSDNFKSDILFLSNSLKSFACPSGLDIMSLVINRKGKWCYDISNTIESFSNGEEHKLVGSLNRLIIKEYGQI